MSEENRTDGPKTLPLPRPTHRLEGPLADRYRQAAASLGARLEGESFDVDRAGVCPELTRALEPVRSRLPKGAAIWIVCSPEQGSALHSSERFSFEAHLLDRLYDEAGPFIEHVTRAEALIGVLEILPAPSAMLQDLGVMDSVKVELSSSSGSLGRLTGLLAMDRELTKAENYLSRDYLVKMVRLAVEVKAAFGSVEELRLPKLHHDIGAFCAPALGSIYFFPDESQDLIIHPPPYKKPDLEETYRGLAQLAKLSSPNLTQRLREMGLLRFDVELIPRRLEELENENLLMVGIDPSGLSAAERGPAIAGRRGTLPRTWHELNALGATMRRKDPLPDARLAQLSEEARVKLAAPSREIAVVSRLLSDLDHIDYPRFYRYNRVRFAAHFTDYSEVKKRYVWQRICRAQLPAIPEPEDEPAAPEPDSGDITFIER